MSQEGKIYMKLALLLRVLFPAGLVLGSLLLFLGRVSATQTSYVPLRSWELEDLAEPIALYPDTIIKALLPASTFPDQIVDAALLIKGPAEASLIKEQQWDASVKVIATYPGVLKMMFEELEWTTRLGEAFINQHKELRKAIQSLRSRARELGNLKSNQHQNVTTQATSSGETVVIIQPTDPEVLYVPQTTTVVYEEHNAADSALVPLATFGLGMALGAALDDEDDDHYYYGGTVWGGGSYWAADDAFDDWMDNRREVWEDYNDRRNDQLEHRQDLQKDRQEYRQEMGKNNNGSANREQYAQRKQQAASRMNEYKTQNPQAASKLDSRKSTSGNLAGVSRQSGSQPWSTSSAKRSAGYSSSLAGSRAGAFQGYGSRASTSNMSARGMSSRSGSYGGGLSAGRGGGGRRR